ncbi:MAG: hypothetical protein R2769_09855 [Saprospiraceae bacterium]
MYPHRNSSFITTSGTLGDPVTLNDRRGFAALSHKSTLSLPAPAEGKMTFINSWSRSTRDS